MIDAPWYRDPIETTAFNLYAMDEEGLFSTRKEKIQKVGKKNILLVIIG